RELLANRDEARPLRRGELGAPEPEITQLVLDVAPARRAPSGERRRGGERLEAGVQPRILALRGKVLRDPGQGAVVRLAQGRRIHDRVEMAHLRPRALDAFVRIV